jgi:hypothetical protein
MNSYLSFFRILVAIVRPAIVIALLTGLWLALRRATLPPRGRVTTWLAVAVPLVGWFGLTWPSWPPACSKGAGAAFN